MTTILGIDWGERRIGVARASTAAALAEPLLTISNPEQDAAITRIGQLVNEQDAESVVVGLPRNLSGEETPQTETVRAFARELEGALQCSIVMFDETLSTQAASDLKHRFPGSDVDSRAAAVILQDYLQTRR